MDVVKNAKKQTELSYSDEDLFVLMSYRKEDEAEAQKAFRIFYKRYSKLLRSLCFSVCLKLDFNNGEELAYYIFNDTMFAIYNSPTYDSRKGKLSTWMSTIAYRKALDLIDEYDMNNNKFVPLNEDIVESIPDVEDEIIEYQTPQRKVLDDALNTLSERDREVLLTCIMYQEKNKHLPDNVLKELCSRYSTTSDYIRQIKSRAFKKIKEHISKNFTFSPKKS